MAAWFVSSVEAIKKDLTPLVDRPTWVLSSYGPAKHQPTIITGLDLSQEELRVRAAQAMKAGTVQEYVCLDYFCFLVRTHIYSVLPS